MQHNVTQGFASLCEPAFIGNGDSSVFSAIKINQIQSGSFQQGVWSQLYIYKWTLIGCLKHIGETGNIS